MNFPITPRLMTPGPVPLSSAVLKVLGRQMLHHRAPEFERVLKKVCLKLPKVFHTTQPILMLSSTGSGAMEAAIVNTLCRGDSIVVVCSGKFGDRWADIAEVYGVKVIRISVPWGHPVNLDDVEEALKNNPLAKAVLTQACETSTGTLHPIKGLASISRKYNCLFMVDAITALATVPILMDDWGIDVVVAGSQKAFMLPTGLSFIALSEKAWASNKSSDLPKFYFDLEKEKKALLKNQTYFSSPVAHICALEKVLSEWEQMGLDHLVRRTQALSKATLEASQLLGMIPYSKAPAPAVSALLVPESIDGEQLRAHLENKYLITTMGGQDHLNGKIIRIGHMGAISDEDLLATLFYLGKSLQDLGSSVTDVQVNEAIHRAKSLLES